MAVKNSRDLHQEHGKDRIRERLEKPRGASSLGDFVLGGVDGVVTTFAVVAGSAGGGLSTAIIIILGLANLVADGFSMAVSNYLGTRSRQQEITRARADEYWQVDEYPDGERQEIREIFARKGFHGAALDRVVEVITSNREVWVETMMAEELKLSETSPQPLRAGLVTFAAFALCGFAPLLPFVLDIGPPQNKFALSAILSAIAFFALGAGKGAVLRLSPFKAGLQTLAIGGAAAALAYAAGAGLRSIVT